MPTSIPTTMQAAVLHAYTGPDALRIETRPVPPLKAGQVLVKVMASPINPSDVLFLEGKYGFTKPTPVVPGFEGSGLVVAGEGVIGRARVGQRVTCAVQASGDGTWAEYVAQSAAMTLPLPKRISYEQGAMALVNPMTAIALVEMAQRGRSRAVVQTAAASALGKMILRLATKAGIEVINVVRRPAQADALAAMGAKHILDSTAPDFDRALAALCSTLDARLAFDAVSGELTRRVLDAMPRGSRIVVYGALSLEAAQANPIGLIFQDKSVEGFWLSDWIGAKNPLSLILASRRAFNLLDGDLESTVQARFPLEKTRDALATYAANMTAGKVLIVPNAGG